MPGGTGTTYSEAAPVAEAIVSYWQRQGYFGIHAWLERRKDAGVMDGWEVRTNIGPDGYPPKEQVAA